MFKNKKFYSTILSIAMVLNMVVPSMGEDIVPENEVSIESVELTSSTDAPEEKEIVSNNSSETISQNVWDKLKYSGTEPVPMKGNDGKYYVVKGTLFKAGSGATSSDKKVLKISKKGIKAGKSGSATLTSEKYGTIEVNVINPKISEKKASLTVGDNKQLSVSNVPEGIPVAWTSSNQNVIQVLSGNCCAVGIGKSKVSAIVGGKAFTCNITVKDKANSTLLYNVGSKPVKMKGIKKIGKLTFNVSDNSISITKGKITSSSPSKTPVSGNISDGHNLLVYSNNSSIESSIDLKIGEKKFILPENTHELPVLKVKNNSIATISEYGVAIGIAPGTTIVTGTYGGKKVKININVNDEIFTGSVDDKVNNIQIIDPINGNDGYSIDIKNDGSYKIIKDSERKTVSENEPDPVQPEVPITYPENYDTNDTPNPPEGYTTISVNAGGGTYEIKYIYVEPGSTFPEFNYVPTKEGYEFDYWEIDGKPLTKDTIITKNSVIIARFKDKNGVKELPDNTDTSDTPNPPEGYDTITIDVGEGTFNGGEGEIKYIYIKDGENFPTFSGVPIREGYDFIGWLIDGEPLTPDTKITKDSVITARWQKKGESKPEMISYTVNYKLMNLDGSTYTIDETDTKSVERGVTVSPDVKSYTGFTSPSKQTVTVSNHNTEINYLYKRNKYHVNAVKGANIASVEGSGDYFYGATVTLKATPEETTSDDEYTVENGNYRYKDGIVHEFDTWSDGKKTENNVFTMPANDVTLTATGSEEQTKIEEYLVTLNAGANVKNVEGNGWYLKGSKANISATLSDNHTDNDYTEESGYRYKRTFTKSFDEWSDGNNIKDRQITVNEPIVLTANGEETEGKIGEQYKLTLSAGDNIASVSNVNGWKDKGTTVDISATPKTDTVASTYTETADYRYKETHTFSFNKWSDNNSHNNRTLTMNQAYNLTATGTDTEGKIGEQYKVTISTNDCIKSVTMEGGWKDKDLTINISCTPKDAFTESGWVTETSNGIADGERYHKKHNYSFVKWSDGNTNRNRSIVVNSPISITAEGKDTLTKDNQEFYLSLGKGNDKIKELSSSSGYKSANTSVIVSATPKDASVEGDFTYNVTDEDDSDYKYKAKHTYSFDKWSDEDINSTRTITMDKAYNLNAYGKENPIGKEDEWYKLTLTRGTGIESVANVSGWKRKGTTVNINATIKEDTTETGWTFENSNNVNDGYKYHKTHDYEFVKWHDNTTGDDVTNNNRSIVMNRAYNLEAVGSDAEGKVNEMYKLTLTKGANITSIPDVGEWHNKGSRVTISANLPENYTENTYTTETGYRYKKIHAFSFNEWSDHYNVNNRELTMDKAYALTATGTDDTSGKNNEEYLLTLNKGTNVTKVKVTDANTSNVSQYKVNDGALINMTSASDSTIEATNKLDVWVIKDKTVTYDCEYPANYTEDAYTTDTSNGYRYKKTHTYTFNGWN